MTTLLCKAAAKIAGKTLADTVDILDYDGTQILTVKNLSSSGALYSDYISVLIPKLLAREDLTNLRDEIFTINVWEHVTGAKLEIRVENYTEALEVIVGKGFPEIEGLPGKEYHGIIEHYRGMFMATAHSHTHSKTL